MADYIPEILMLKEILLSHRSFKEAFFRIRLNEKISQTRAPLLKQRVLTVLRHDQKLSFEILNLFPDTEKDKDEYFLFLLFLSVLRNEKDRDFKDEFFATFDGLRLLGDKEKVYEVLFSQACHPFVIPEEVKKAPYLYNSLLLEIPEFLLRLLAKEYHPEEVLRIAKSLRQKPHFDYGMMEKKDIALQGASSYSLVNGENYYRLLKPLSSSLLKTNDLFSVSPLEAEAFADLSLPSLSPRVLLFEGDDVSSYLPYAAFLKKTYRPVLTPVLKDGVRYRMAVDLQFTYHLPFVTPLCSSSEMVKTYLSYEDYDVVTLFAPDSLLGLSPKRPECLPSLRKEKVEEAMIQEKRELENAFPFVKKGGVLLYVSHSLLKAEGKDRISSFLKQHREFMLEKEASLLDYGKDGDIGYYALLRRNKE